MTGKGQKLAPLELMVIILLVNSVQLLVLATFLRYIYIYIRIAAQNLLKILRLYTNTFQPLDSRGSTIFERNPMVRIDLACRMLRYPGHSYVSVTI